MESKCKISEISLFKWY